MHAKDAGAWVGAGDSTPVAGILIAEDDFDDTLLLQLALDRAGVTVPVSFVRDGQEVMDYLGGKPPFENRTVHPMPALVVLDLDLPRVGGFEVLEWLRPQPHLKHLLVVVLSGLQWPAQLDRAHALGASFIFLKPSDPEELVEIAHRLNMQALSSSIPLQNAPATQYRPAA
jgi:CheY-like chemotaxis protein